MVTSFDYENDHIKGVNLQDQLTDKNVHVRAAAVVNATGPGLIFSATLINRSSESVYIWLKVSILYSPQEKLPIKQALYFDVPGWPDDFCHTAGKNNVCGHNRYWLQRQYWRCSYNPWRCAVSGQRTERFFSIREAIAQRYRIAWAGLRPLIHEEGKSASELSRKDEILFRTPDWFLLRVASLRAIVKWPNGCWSGD